MTAFHYSTHIQPVPDSRPCAITNTYRSSEFCKYSLTNAYNYLFTIIKRIDLREELTIIINLIKCFQSSQSSHLCNKIWQAHKTTNSAVLIPRIFNRLEGKHFSLEFAKPAEHGMADSYSIILNQWQWKSKSNGGVSNVLLWDSPASSLAVYWSIIVTLYAGLSLPIINEFCLGCFWNIASKTRMTMVYRLLWFCILKIAPLQR